MYNNVACLVIIFLSCIQFKLQCNAKKLSKDDWSMENNYPIEKIAPLWGPKEGLSLTDEILFDFDDNEREKDDWEIPGDIIDKRHFKKRELKNITENVMEKIKKKRKRWKNNHFYRNFHKVETDKTLSTNQYDDAIKEKANNDMLDSSKIFQKEKFAKNVQKERNSPENDESKYEFLSDSYKNKYKSSKNKFHKNINGKTLIKLDNKIDELSNENICERPKTLQNLFNVETKNDHFKFTTVENDHFYTKNIDNENDNVHTELFSNQISADKISNKIVKQINNKNNVNKKKNYKNKADNIRTHNDIQENNQIVIKDPEQLLNNDTLNKNDENISSEVELDNATPPNKISIQNENSDDEINEETVDDSINLNDKTPKTFNEIENLKSNVKFQFTTDGYSYTSNKHFKTKIKNVNYNNSRIGDPFIFSNRNNLDPMFSFYKNIQRSFNPFSIIEEELKKINGSADKLFFPNHLFPKIKRQQAQFQDKVHFNNADFKKLSDSNYKEKFRNRNMKNLFQIHNNTLDKRKKITNDNFNLNVDKSSKLNNTDSLKKLVKRKISEKSDFIDYKNSDYDPKSKLDSIKSDTSFIPQIEENPFGFVTSVKLTSDQSHDTFNDKMKNFKLSIEREQEKNINENDKDSNENQFKMIINNPMKQSYGLPLINSEDYPQVQEYSKMTTNKYKTTTNFRKNKSSCRPSEILPKLPELISSKEKEEEDKEYADALSGKLAERVVNLIMAKVEKDERLKTGLGLCPTPVNQMSHLEISKGNKSSMKVSAIADIMAAIDRLSEANKSDACLQLPPDLYDFLAWLLTDVEVNDFNDDDNKHKGDKQKIKNSSKKPKDIEDYDLLWKNNKKITQINDKKRDADDFSTKIDATKTYDKNNEEDIQHEIRQNSDTAEHQTSRQYSKLKKQEAEYEKNEKDT